ncbi:uncharacterized protein LOC125823335 [Solanum verrucosum]|uniref:uncharacterized protein LOC125823335 n=1 Tax=Solanum verrucosum TaxID=315347 RepID=UPI0020D058ED|nr:uncharacterized protein LOC125823335 [Solanum verrucosum]
MEWYLEGGGDQGAVPQGGGGNGGGPRGAVPRGVGAGVGVKGLGAQCIEGGAVHREGSRGGGWWASRWGVGGPQGAVPRGRGGGPWGKVPRERCEDGRGPRGAVPRGRGWGASGYNDSRREVRVGGPLGAVPRGYGGGLGASRWGLVGSVPRGGDWWARCLKVGMGGLGASKQGGGLGV